MPLDIRTLAFVLGLMHVLQLVVFIHQYRINKAYRGIGSWVLWSLAEVIGFGFMFLRGISSIRAPSIIGQNSFIVLGIVLLYVGILRFFDRKVNLAIIIPVFAVFLAALAFFLFVHDDIQVRTVLISGAVATFAFLSARALSVNKTRAASASANFVAAVFLIHGGHFIFRAVMTLTGTRIESFFAPTWFNITALLDAIIVAIVWTLGFIIMINQRLNADMTEAKEHFELIFNTSPDAAVITQLADGMIVNINNGFTMLSGFSREEAIGRSGIETFIWKNPADRTRIVGELREKGFRDNFESEFQRKDGSTVLGLMSAKVINLSGVPHIISVTRDITERKQADDKIKALLREKEILLKEVHHRIKNNMSSMMSLLSMQSNALKNPEAVAALQEAKGRLRSMGVLYDKLYRSENLREMSIRNYLPSLIDEIVGVFPNRGLVKIEKKIDDIVLGVNLMSPLGIIVNELITNAMKHAFAGREDGSIYVSAAAAKGLVTLVIEDNGIGIPESVGFESTEGFGLQLVGMLTAQLDGIIRIERGKGTRFVLEFSA
jgi:PAS domain S-box-containing protein